MIKKCCEKYQTNINFIPKEIRYHGFWSTEYQTRARKTPNGKEEEMKHKEPVETNRERSLERDTERETERSVFTAFESINIIDMKDVQCIKNIRTLNQSLICERVATNLSMEAHLLRIWKANF